MNQENGNITKVELVQDELVDPDPFKLRPFELASLLDPKCLEAFSALGGVDAILEGLGTHRTRGLTIVSRGSSDSRPGTSQRQDQMDKHPLPTIAVTALHEVSQDEENSDPHLASLSERRRLFGENVLPQRASKSLLALMWLTLKDKVLVHIILYRFSIIFILFISRSCCLSQWLSLRLALGLFQDFGTPLPAGQLPVDWVESIAIMVAVLIVVRVMSPAVYLDLVSHSNFTGGCWVIE